MFSPSISCYGWRWDQALLLYAPVENDVQTIRVYGVIPGVISEVTTDLIECEVLQINGRPAFDVIRDFAYHHGGKYKDLNVRFNMALMSASRYSNLVFGM